MNIGEKIKNLRTSKMITQQELAGDFITRNMLSRIEHGAALPSLPIVMYLANRLGVPAGFLLAEEENEFLYQKIRHMPNIRRAFGMGDYRICRELCASALSESDDEIALLMAECALEIAKEEFLAGNLHNACYWLDAALRDAADTHYNTQHVTASAVVYFRFMRGISPSLCSYEAENLVPSERDLAAWQDSFCRYVLIAEQIQRHVSPHPYQASTPAERHLALHLEAAAACEKEQWACALGLLEQILGDEQPPVPVLLLCVLADMERCCKMLEDYKGAYDHSIHKLSVLEKLLAERTV